MPERFTPLDGPAHDALRQIARDAHARGDLAEAIRVQRMVMASAAPETDGNRTGGGGPNGIGPNGIGPNGIGTDDILFLALLLFASQDAPEGTRVLRDGLTRFPAEPALHENLGVFLLTQGDPGAAAASCRQALALGSTSPNTHDCLCDALHHLGQWDAAVQAGRNALEAKHALFGGREPVAPIPAGMPPPFNPDNPAENVIAYSLWGNEPRYLAPLRENVAILPHLFPAWTIRVYHDASVDHSHIADLSRRGVQMRRMILPQGQPGHRRLLWRFEAISDPAVKRFLIRDADSLLSVKERVAVDAWTQSRFFFHAMRDWYTHTDLLLAGMWGGVGNILPSPPELFRLWTPWRIENDHVDQDILSDTVWPTIRHATLIHDSIFHGTLGGVPFPPFGHLPAGHHIGQNAFVHFTQAGQTPS